LKGAPSFPEKENSGKKKKTAQVGEKRRGKQYRTGPKRKKWGGKNRGEKKNTGKGKMRESVRAEGAIMDSGGQRGSQWEKGQRKKKKKKVTDGDVPGKTGHYTEN